MSRFIFLEAAQTLGRQLFNRNLIIPGRLISWTRNPVFTETSHHPIRIGVDCNIRRSTTMTRSEQEQHGWNDAPLCDLALAHVAAHMATGKDIFEGNIVRARQGALYFHPDGLGNVPFFFDEMRSPLIAASRAVSSPAPRLPLITLRSDTE